MTYRKHIKVSEYNHYLPVSAFSFLTQWIQMLFGPVCHPGDRPQRPRKVNLPRRLRPAAEPTRTEGKVTTTWLNVRGGEASAGMQRRAGNQGRDGGMQ